MEAPRITIYGKVLNNKDDSVYVNYREWKNEVIWNYGIVNGVRGGESPAVIEFDIWNNEPAFNGLTAAVDVHDAVNCSLTVWDDETQTSTTKLSHQSGLFMNARCVTENYESTFQPFAGPIKFNNIYGNVDYNNIGVLSGQHGGDHTKIQTKVVIPDFQSMGLQPLPEGNRDFVFVFSYEYM